MPLSLTCMGAQLAAPLRRGEGGAALKRPRQPAGRGGRPGQNRVRLAELSRRAAALQSPREAGWRSDRQSRQQEIRTGMRARGSEQGIRGGLWRGGGAGGRRGGGGRSGTR